jgi:AraC-like DNA-binding protein
VPEAVDVLMNPDSTSRWASGRERLILFEHNAVAGAELWRHDTSQPVHVHEFMEIVLVKSGGAVHRMRSGSCPITTGSVLFVRPGEWHAYDDPYDFEIWNLYIPYKTLATELTALGSHPVLAAFRSARTPTAGVPVTRTRQLGPGDDGRRKDLQGVPPVDIAAIEPYLIELTQPSRRDDRSLTRLGQLLVVLDALAPAFTFLKPGQSVATAHPAVIAATELLDTAPGHAWSLPELAEGVHVSASYLCRLFTRELGISPLHYLERHRLELTAQLLIEGTMSMSQISSSAGWSDSNYMTRRFRAAHGMSPTRYREVFRRRPRHAAKGMGIGG